MRTERMKSFNIDFNWLNEKYAPGDAFANAEASAWADWYQEMGCNNFWTFAVSYNGHAWYDSKFAPKIEGLKGNFTKECVIEGHKRGMTVFAYHCLGANPVIERAHPDWARPAEIDQINMVLCDEYIDLFCKLIAESITECEYDGLVIDWFRGPMVRKGEWIPKEKEEFKLLMGYPFPKEPDAAEIAEYEKRSIEKAWRRIKDTVVSVGDIPIWTNHPFDKVDDPVWNGNILLKEVDYLLNVGPDVRMLNWLKRESGAHTQIVQNLCGWPDHDLSIMDQLDLDKVGLFGFAAADPLSCLPFVSVEETLKNVTPEELEQKPYLKEVLEKRVNANKKNIEIMRKMFE